jgi:2-methylisocitrate lyase-like PEP mutase family enzyme
VRSSLRTAISDGPIILAPGAYDGLTARLVAEHGFPAVYMTGAGTSVARGYPDYGLLTMTEMAANAALMSEAAGIPVTGCVSATPRWRAGRRPSRTDGLAARGGLEAAQ